MFRIGKVLHEHEAPATEWLHRGFVEVVSRLASLIP